MHNSTKLAIFTMLLMPEVANAQLAPFPGVTLGQLYAPSKDDRYPQGATVIGDVGAAHIDSDGKTAILSDVILYGQRFSRMIGWGSHVLSCDVLPHDAAAATPKDEVY